MTVRQPISAHRLAVNPPAKAAAEKSDQTFESAADLFRVMSAPARLKIINALCAGEKNVTDLLAEVNTTQPNMSQHLNTLYHAGILGKRREGVHIYYRIVDQRIVSLCEAVCQEVARKALAGSQDS